MNQSAKKVAVAGIVAGVIVSMLGFASGTGERDPYLRPAHAPAPDDNKLTPPRADLGKALFFDPRLSSSNWISCATCHNPALGWSDGLPTGLGHGMSRLRRATPTIINTAFNTIQMWDGRKPTLEEQALGPIEAGVEMNQELSALVAKLEKISGYRKMFERAYPGEGVSGKTIGKAIASFERTVLSGESAFDRWRAGQSEAVSDPVKRGFTLFTGKANCVACHEGFNFTDNGFHNIGVKEMGEEPDLGRYNERKIAAMKGAFKTPTLRDIALTAPYMHNGIYRTLDEVIEHYDRGGDIKDNLSLNIKPLGLTVQEKQDLVAFMKSLTGTQAAIIIPVLPQ